MNVEMPTTSAPLGPGDLLLSAVQERRPLVLVLGQDAWAESENGHTLLAKALDRLGRPGKVQRGWSALLGADPVPDEFDDWLAERFARRVHPHALEVISELPWSAVFTSSFDPTLRKLLSGPGREPAVILTAQETPRTVRSRARPPLYYLFSHAGVHDPQARLPRTRSECSARRVRHAVPLLDRVLETATALGLIVVEGFSSGNDWFRIEDLLGIVGNAVPNQVLWFGGRPRLGNDVDDQFDEAVESGRILVEPRRLGTVVAELRALDRLSDIAPPESEAAGTISLRDGRRMETTAEQRLRIEAVASIVDDSWTAFLPPLGKEAEYATFRRFHGNLEGPRLLVEGVRRGFAIERDFEGDLRKRIADAVADRARSDVPIIVEGQSGSGKSVALARAAASVRTDEKLPVLYAIGRVPASHDVSEFCESAERAGAPATLIVCDANADHDRYYDLLMGLRSRGRRTVVVGSQYRSDVSSESQNHVGIEVPVRLSNEEQNRLAALVGSYVDVSERTMSEPGHMLAFLYRFLPASRPRIGAGLNTEARSEARTLRSRGRQFRKIEPMTLIHQRMMEAGIVSQYLPLLGECEDELQENFEDAAHLLIDFVMLAGSLNCLLPVNLLMRAVTGRSQEFDLSMVVHLFLNLDLFRWRAADREGSELYVGPRLTLEAEVLCRYRFGGAASEAQRLLELISAVRDDGRDGERTEIRFLLDLLQQVGPDGRRGDRYKVAYVDIARALTVLREHYGTIDARLILQESAFRRHAVRRQVVEDDARLPLLEEARDVVQDALDGIAQGSVYAARRTKDSLLVERAAIYGFLAWNLADNGAGVEDIWRSYDAARTAVGKAVSASDNYYPYDIGLWMPSDLLGCDRLREGQRAELTADIYSTLDQVDASELSPSQRERFLSRRMRVGTALHDQRLTEDAYAELEAGGSTAGYFLRARGFIGDVDRSAGAIDDPRIRDGARRAAGFLGDRFDRIAGDPRCLRLLLEARWIAEVGRWPLRGERQPLPFADGARSDLLDILRALNQAAGGSAGHVPRYLEAVLAWLAGDVQSAVGVFGDVAQDTDHEFPGRVVRRHVITDADGAPCRFDGRVERDRGEGHWSIRVDGLDRRVDLLSRDFPKEDIAYGRVVRGFSIAFNFIGPIADPVR